MSLKRVLVANRGEIAVRIVRACHALDIEAVVAVSDADRDSLAARMADRTVCIGPARSALSYLNVPALITAARGTACDAVHPGYGFLSERAVFAQACADNDLVFVGPDPRAIQKMGNKLEARALARDCGVPLAEGSRDIRSVEDAARIASDVGYPVLLKAAAGGGGRGIRVVRSADDLRTAYEGASAEALAAFGDGTVYVERYIEDARHIEIQVLGDEAGKVLHLGERDCSPQRRYQKMIEAAPAADVPDALRRQMQTAAVTLAKNIGYRNAGTVEFVVDRQRQECYFLEMNTRIQVEHPVTEVVTGIDLVSWQIRIAGGETLGIEQDMIRPRGHALECRINAESPQHGFRPSPGRLTAWDAPAGDGIRLDTHCYAGYMVPPFYDSLLAKLIVHGDDRPSAIARMREALGHFEVRGVETTIPFLSYVLRQNEFLDAPVNTRWLETCALRYAAQYAI